MAESPKDTAGRCEATAENDPAVVPRRVAFIKPDTSASVDRSTPEMVMTVPHLIIREVIAFQLIVIVLGVISLLVDAPLDAIADPFDTPDVAKAPWYFVGLQELLHYFHPVVAGVLLPGLVVFALFVIPYFDVNIKRKGLWVDSGVGTFAGVAAVVIGLCVFLAAYHVYSVLITTAAVGATMLLAAFLPRWRRISVPAWIMNWFVLTAITLIVVGYFFRGPEWAWTLPWEEGIY